MEKGRSIFSGDVFVHYLRSEQLKKWILRLRDDNFLDGYERTIQTYIVSWILWQCFYSPEALYYPRKIKIEERTNKEDSDIPDIMLPSTIHKNIDDVWVEIKDYFGGGEITSSQLRKLENDFKKAHNSSGLGVVMIMLDYEEILDVPLSELCAKYPDVEVIVIGKTEED